MTQLYNLDPEIRALGDECPICNGAPPLEGCPECRGLGASVLERGLSRLEGDVRALVPKLALRVAELDTEAAVLEAAEAHIAARRAQRLASIAFIKAWIMREMEAAHIDKIKDALASIWIQNNPPGSGIAIADEAAIPESFKRATLQMPLADVPKEWRGFIKEIDIPKGPIKEWLESTGEIIPGADVVRETGRHLRIKT